MPVIEHDIEIKQRDRELLFSLASAPTASLTSVPVLSTRYPSPAASSNICLWGTRGNLGDLRLGDFGAQFAGGTGETFEEVLQCGTLTSCPVRRTGWCLLSERKGPGACRPLGKRKTCIQPRLWSAIAEVVLPALGKHDLRNANLSGQRQKVIVQGSTSAVRGEERCITYLAPANRLAYSLLRRGIPLDSTPSSIPTTRVLSFGQRAESRLPTSHRHTNSVTQPLTVTIRVDTHRFFDTGDTLRQVSTHWNDLNHPWQYRPYKNTVQHRAMRGTRNPILTWDAHEAREGFDLFRLGTRLPRNEAEEEEGTHDMSKPLPAGGFMA
ncbi:hypothetical protein BKA70DRAFT_1395985 [Coprinopsis sp. MPI-PUGE-AT-0042]|nr:hypothetical protein BKA70DRAFT_1395985 [Coprinopsis sp. MPI-PUGE-AT-0042]